MGFQAIIDKVGQQVEKKTHNKSPGGGYGHIAGSHRPPPPPPNHPPPSYTEFEEPPRTGYVDEHHTGIGLLGMGAPNPEPGRRSRSNSKAHPPITHPNYTGPERKGVATEYEDPARQYYAPPPGKEESAFTGRGLIGQLMAAGRTSQEGPVVVKKEKPGRYRGHSSEPPAHRHHGYGHERGPFGDGEVYIGPRNGGRSPGLPPPRSPGLHGPPHHGPGGHGGHGGHSPGRH